MVRTTIKNIMFTGIGLMLGTSVYASTVQLRADGANNYTDAAYWTVSHLSGGIGPAITSIELNVNGAGGFFDVDGEGSFACNPHCLTGGMFDLSGEGPVLSPGSGSVDSFDWMGVNPQKLTMNVSNFGVGDSFSFGVDVDGIGGSGNEMAGASFVVMFADGSSEMAMLENICGAQCSEATITSGNVGEPSAVPLPGAVWLFGSGILGLAGLTRRRKK